MSRDLKQVAVNCLLGVHLGDAFGVPFECMTRPEILAATGGDGVTQPRFDMDPLARKIPDTRGLSPGATSDDSQLANAVANGFILAGRYDHELHVLLHLTALWRDVAGWGGTTKRSLYEIDRWYRARRKSFGPHPPPVFKDAKDEKLWSEAVPRDPSHPARWRTNARGNAPSMKIAPFGLHCALSGGGDFETETGEALEEIFRFSRMTHADPVCAVAAYAVAGVINDSIVASPAAAAENLLERVTAAERIHFWTHRGDDRFSTALAAAISLAGDPEALWSFGSTGKSDSLTSVPMALAIWLRHLDDVAPDAAVLEAINAGGDTDTVAAMVGAMMGAASGRPDWWPDGWVAALADRGALASHLGGLLHDVGARRRLPEGYDPVALKAALGYL